MAGPPSPPLLLSTMSAAGTLFNTYTTAKRVMVADDVINIPGNFLKSRAHIRWEVRGGLSNVATTPGNVFFQVMMGASNIIAWTSGNLALNASARTLLPFTLDIDLIVTATGTGTSAAFTGTGRFGGIHLTGTDAMINVPTTTPTAGTGWDSVSATGNVMELFVGFSNSQAGNGVQLYSCDVFQYAGLGQ